MRHIFNNIQRSAMLLVLLIAGWVAGIPLSAQTVVELAPDQKTPNASDFTSLSDEATGVSFAFDIGEGKNTPKYYSSGGGAIRAYYGNTITMTVLLRRLSFSRLLTSTATTRRWLFLRALPLLTTLPPIYIRGRT